MSKPKYIEGQEVDIVSAMKNKTVQIVFGPRGSLKCYWVRDSDGVNYFRTEAQIHPVPSAVFTEAHKEAMWKVMGNRFSFNDWDELMDRFSREYGEQPEGEVQ